MKKKLLLVLLLFSSSIKSINADFKHMFEGNIFSQIQKKQNIKGKKSDWTHKLFFSKINKSVEKKQIKSLDTFVIKDNSIQNPLQNPNPNPFLSFFSNLNQNIVKSSPINNKLFINFLKKISASFSPSKPIITTAIKAATPKIIPNAKAFPEVTKSSNVTTVDNSVSSLDIVSTLPAPNLSATSVDSPALNLPFIDSTQQNVMNL
ncbi:MAG: hypothetical protein ACRYGR_09145 [Janthinobacterium lividum]